MRALLPLAVAGLAACSLVPPAAVPDAGLAAAPFTVTGTVSGAPVAGNGGRLDGFPELAALVRASLAANADLRVAYATLDRVRAAAAEARALRLPQTTLESSLRFDDRATQPGVNSLPSTDFDAVAAAGWDVDLFGRLRSAALASSADADAAAAAYEGLRQAIVAETVGAYLDHCGARQAAAALAAAVAAQERLAATLGRQRAAGEVSGLEVAQARAALGNLRAGLPVLAAAGAAARYRLAELQGRPPAAELPLRCPVVPRFDGPLPAGDGQALLLRRPDIREADRRLAAATARIGVARAELYPRLNLGGAVGFITGGLVADATPFLSWSFPNQGPARARIAHAEAGGRAALAAWDATVLRALREVETAIAALDQEARRNADLAAAAAAAGDLADRAWARARLGDAAPTVGHDADRAAALAQLARLLSDVALARGQFALLRALGCL